MNFLTKVFRGDRVIWMIFMLLCLISIVEVFSASSTLAYRGNYWDPIVGHTTHLLMGLGVVLLCLSLPSKFLSFLIFLLPVSIVLLLITKFMGASVNGADRWLSIGPLSFQPSEFAKLSLIAFTAFALSRWKNSKEDQYFKWILIAAITTCGIIFIDNFSTAAMLFSVVFLMMFIGQIPFQKLFKLLLGIIAFGIIFVAFLRFAPDNILEAVPRAPTWKNRIFQKEAQTEVAKFEITDENYQVSHAKIAIARGKVLGVMPGNSQQRDFLPQAYSDFIFAIIIEEMGLIGGLAILFLYVILFVRSGMIAARCEKLFPKYLVLGSAMLIVMQALANMMVAVNLIPFSRIKISYFQRRTGYLCIPIAAKSDPGNGFGSF